MEPFVKNGNLVLVETFTFRWREPQIGDVVSVHWQGKTVIKRIVSIAGNAYLVSGDNKSDSLPIPKLNRKYLLAKVWRF